MAILVYFMAIWYIVWLFGIYVVWPFGNLVAVWYIFPHFGKLNKEKFGNPGRR
jgi:predicted outer membrane lipoprotein